MAVNVVSTGSVAPVTPSDAVPEVTRTPPADAGVDERVDDATAFRVLVVGFVAGTLVMTLVAFGLALLAGLDVATSAAIAPVPGLVAGFFFGMTGYLGVHLAHHDH